VALPALTGRANVDPRFDDINSARPHSLLAPLKRSGKLA
jgi:hypothetical protein